MIAAPDLLKNDRLQPFVEAAAESLQKFFEFDLQENWNTALDEMDIRDVLKDFLIRMDWSCKMTRLKNSTKTFPVAFRAGISLTTGTGSPFSNDKSETTEYSRVKAQLKRAVDSVDAPEYLIDAIKSAIRR